MPLESITWVGDMNAANPPGTDPKNQGDDHLRGIKRGLRDSFAGFAGAILVTGVDGGAVNAYTLTPAQALPAYTTRMLVLFVPTVTNTGASTLNISSLGALPIVSINNVAVAANDLQAGWPYLAEYDGTSVRLSSVTKNYIDQLAFGGTLPAQTRGFLGSDGAVANFTQTFTGYAPNEVLGTAIASAATVNLTGVDGSLIHITGNVTINAFTIPLGAERVLVFDGTPTLTYNATSLKLPGAQDIVVKAGDTAVVRGDTGGARVTVYTPANGAPVGEQPYAMFAEIQAKNVASATTVSANNPNTRILNTTVKNNIPGVSLAANAITISQPGVYRIKARAPVNGNVGPNQLFFSSTSIGLGLFEITGANNYTTAATIQNDAVLSGDITITTPKTLTLYHYTTTTGSLGNAVNLSGVTSQEVYTQIEITKVR